MASAVRRQRHGDTERPQVHCLLFLLIPTEHTGVPKPISARSKRSRCNIPGRVVVFSNKLANAYVGTDSVINRPDKQNETYSSLLASPFASRSRFNIGQSAGRKIVIEDCVLLQKKLPSTARRNRMRN
ncbi:hypothetical protein Trydic_g983 [Trypoxylus dichotomus]